MPYSLNRFDIAAMMACAQDLRHACKDAATMEAAAAAVCHTLHRDLVDDDGQPATALVRCYKTHRFGGLPADLQQFAQRAFGTVAFTPPDREMKCLTLLGTAGTRPEWNARAASRNHQAIPMPTPQIVAKAPMIAQLVRELGFDIAQVVRPSRDVVRDLAGRSYGVFHVADAKGSPYIPAQEEFVIPYGIRSVVGFGSALTGSDLFAVILFSTVPVSTDVADRFRTVAAELTVSLLAFSPEMTFGS